jgi:aminoglycoside 3'-phosphotransferase-2
MARVPAAIKVRIIAKVLRTLHAIDASTCPFDERLDVKIARAADNVQLGRIEEEHFDEENLGRSASDLFSDMMARRPGHEDLVVTHGDACFPNFMLDGSTFTGFVDCGRMGVADRYQDLALICRSIEYELGARWVDEFFRYYGLETVDNARLGFYRLLDEFS